MKKISSTETDMRIAVVATTLPRIASETAQRNNVFLTSYYKLQAKQVPPNADVVTTLTNLMCYQVVYGMIIIDKLESQLGPVMDYLNEIEFDKAFLPSLASARKLEDFYLANITPYMFSPKDDAKWVEVGNTPLGTTLMTSLMEMMNRNKGTSWDSYIQSFYLLQLKPQLGFMPIPEANWQILETFVNEVKAHFPI